MTEQIAAGVELSEGATHLTLVVAAGADARRWRHRFAAPSTPEDVLAAIERLLPSAVAAGSTGAALPPVALGVCLWDGVEARLGTTRAQRYAEGWEGFPLAARLSARWGAPARLEAAPRAAALAEARLGAGRGARAVLYVLLGRSIWSVLVVDGLPVSGEGEQAGALAHWRVGPAGPRCSCGAAGHLEPIASAQAIVRTTIGLASDSDASLAAVLAATHGRAEALTAPTVAHLAAAGEPVARAVLDAAQDGLAAALANLVAVLDPGLIVLGGPLAEAPEDFVAPLAARVAALCAPWRPAPAIVPGVLGAGAAVVGARLLVAAE